MRSAIENWLLGHWYATSRPPWYLRILEPVYRAGFSRSQKRGRTATPMYRSSVPIVVVGNISAGGSGKTPLVIRLCELALELNLKPGIASTGYGRQSRETVLVSAESDTGECGDEPVLLAMRTGVPVVVSSNRCDAVNKLNGMKLDLIFSDDGLQKADLHRDMEFCVVDGERGLGNGHLIPAGPLREGAERLRQVDQVVTNGEWNGRPTDLNVNIMHLQARAVCSLDGTKNYAIEEFRQKYTGVMLHAVAGIGNPARFFKMLEDFGIKAKSKGFSDHHQFKRRSC
jgi:tetraacyldisaccharide 4'-kinase